MALPWIAAAWKTQLQTGFPSADRFYIDFRGYDYPAIADTLTYTAITSGTQWSGYSNATGGSATYLLDMPTKFVLDIRAKPTFAFDTASSQYLGGWYISGSDWAMIFYQASSDTIRFTYRQGAVSTALTSSAYLDTPTLQAVRRITVSVDTTTGSTAGSELWIDGISVDTTWGIAIPARTVRVPKFWFRQDGVGNIGAWDLNTVRYFPGVTATTAQVTAHFSTVYTEEIIWYLNSCSLGHTRVNVTRYVTSRYCERMVSDPDTGSLKANRLSLELKSVAGEFADDQYAAWDPANAVYNGTSAQAYMRRRCRVMAETWYGDNFESYFAGRVEGGFERSTAIGDISRVNITAVDQTAELGMRRVRRGRYYQDDYLTSATEADSLLHSFVRLGTRREIYNYLANSSFENATIANSWASTGGTLSRQASPLVGTYCGQIVTVGATQNVYQTVLFTGTKKLNVGETWTFSIYLQNAAAAASDIDLEERDASSANGISTTAYSLSGGDGWVRYDVSHTVTDSTSDRLRVYIEVPVNTTLKFDCAMLTQSDRAYEWFVLNDNDGAAGDESADDADYSTYDTHGFAVDVVTIQHGWARIEPGDTPWDHIKDLAQACIAYKCGFNECGVFIFRAILGDTFSDPASMETITAARDITAILQTERANKILVQGTYITITATPRYIWAAARSGAFIMQNDGRLAEVVANGATWPPSATYGSPFLCRYDFGIVQPDRRGRTGPGTIPGAPVSATGFGVSGPGRTQQLIDGQEIIGATNASLSQVVDGGTPNFLTVTTLDLTTYANGAVILLTNSTGAQRTIRDVVLYGKLVIKTTGTVGFVHDSFVDWDRVEAEGEHVLQIVNDYIITKAQVEKIANWHWKYNKDVRHQYRITKSGAWYHLEPGDTVTLTIGGAGQEENISATCRIVSVQNEGMAGSLGQSTIVLDEIMEGFVYDSTALARFVAASMRGTN